GYWAASPPDWPASWHPRPRGRLGLTAARPDGPDCAATRPGRRGRPTGTRRAPPRHRAPSAPGPPRTAPYATRPSGRRGRRGWPRGRSSGRPGEVLPHQVTDGVQVARDQRVQEDGVFVGVGDQFAAMAGVGSAADQGPLRPAVQVLGDADELLVAREREH